jgi:hypothetical protein
MELFKLWLMIAAYTKIDTAFPMQYLQGGPDAK